MMANLTREEIARRVEDALLQRAGARSEGGEIRYPCLRHDDQHPSAGYDPKKRTWYCFPCGKGGGVIELARDLRIPINGDGDGHTPAARLSVSKPDFSHVKFGAPEFFEYQDANGTPIFRVVRRDAINPPDDMPKSERKRIYQERPNGAGGWDGGKGIMEGVARCLYSLPMLAKAAGQRVYVVEGERKADRLVSGGLIATTSVCGAGKWQDSYADALQSAREVIVLPDHDEVGAAHGRDVAGSIFLRGIPVKVIDLTDLREHQDVLDWLEAGHTIAEIECFADASSLWSPEDWPELVPFEAPANLPDFPLEALPAGCGALTAMIREVAECRQTPLWMSALIGLSILASTTAKKFRIQFGHTHDEPLNLWVMVIDLPGSRKSPVFRDLTEPLGGLQKSIREEREAFVCQMESKRKAAERAIEKLEKQAGDSDDKAERERLAEEAGLQRACLPDVPARCVLQVGGDVTIEKLGVILADQHGKLLLASPEAGALFDVLAGKYSGGIESFDLLLQSHTGDDFFSDRIGRKAINIPRPALSLALCAQPQIIHTIAENKAFRGRGLLGRFLYALPSSNIGSRLYQDRPINRDVAIAYDRLIRELYEIPSADGTDPEKYHLLRIEGAALSEWASRADQIELMQADGEDLSGITDWASKLASSAVGRIAGVLHLVQHRQKWEPEISVETIRASWAIGWALVEHAKAVFAMLGDDPQMSLAVRILKWIQRHRLERFTLRDCHRHNRSVGKPEELLPGIQILISRGYLREEPSKPTGGRPGSPTYLVNPTLKGQK